MAKNLKRPLSIALGALAATMLGGCYYGDVYGASYAGGDCATRYGDAYYDYDGYAYDDGYGYDCYDASDYGSGFVNIGFGGGWYDDYYYPGYGLWMFDTYRNRYPLRDRYLDYWGGRRAWWKHHGGRKDWKPGRPGWHRGDRDGDGPRGTRPGRPGTPPATGNPGRPDGAHPDRPGRWNRWNRDRDHPRGTRPDNPGMPPATGNPGRPRWGGDRPGRPDREPGAGRSRQIRDVIAPRNDRPAPSAMPARGSRPERPAPAIRRDPPRPAPSGGRARMNNERPD